MVLKINRTTIFIALLVLLLLSIYFGCFSKSRVQEGLKNVPVKYVNIQGKNVKVTPSPTSSTDSKKHHDKKSKEHKKTNGPKVTNKPNRHNANVLSKLFKSKPKVADELTHVAHVIEESEKSNKQHRR